MCTKVANNISHLYLRNCFIIIILSTQNAELTDKLAASETEVAELKNQVEDLEYHLNSATQRVDKLDRHLADTMQKLKTYQEGEIKVQGGGEGVSKNKVNKGILLILEVC